ncbi:MAG: glutamine--fructose-6-phosphate transaminase (isomerizing) [Bacilli bacterium]|jgi:glucosamine--fructose-6-phosphate aminotransferase (isomerizing)
MCGIVGGVSPNPIYNYLIEGLKTIEYRGYDSAGIAVLSNKKVEIHRVLGRVQDLDEAIVKPLLSPIGIGHTRWATHGKPSVANAHPHMSSSGLFTIIHNGVIENFRNLKKSLVEKGYDFHSETDTEVIANLLEDNFLKTKDVLLALKETMLQLKGSYALAILFTGEMDKVFFAKNHSPLLIGHAEDGNFLASDYLPMLKVASQFLAVEDRQYGYVSQRDVALYGLEKNEPLAFSYHKTNLKAQVLDLNGYDHYMLKEIEEADQCLNLLIANYYDGEKYLFNHKMIKEMQEADNIVFLACGTSYHACLIGSEYMRRSGKRSDVYIASEWAYNPYSSGNKTVYIVVSQSGETADLINCMAIIKKIGSTVITISNTQGSTLARNAKYTILLYAGVEVAVASTKAYVAQVAVLAMIVGALNRKTNVVDDLLLVIKAQRIIIENHQKVIELAEFIATKKDVYFLGRGLDYYLALECSLKLKEITYIHSEAFPGGELKHGPIALIEQDTPVIGFCSDPTTAEQMRSNMHEVEARGARIIIISSQSLSQTGDDFVVSDLPLYLTPLIKVIFGQYLAYYVALKRGLNIDKPRNLAKSVTVE